MRFSDTVLCSMVYCTCILTKYGCVFLKLGESIYVAMDLIPILLGSLPLAHNAQSIHRRRVTRGRRVVVLLYRVPGECFLGRS